MSKQLTPQQKDQVLTFLKPYMTVVNKGFLDQYFYCVLSDEEVAHQMGPPFTHSKVRKVRLSVWGKSRLPTAAHEPIPPPSPPPPPQAPAKPPVPDAVGCFWERLDIMQASLDRVEHALAEHRANNAAVQDEHTKMLSQITKITLAIHNEWTGKK